MAAAPLGIVAKETSAHRVQVPGSPSPNKAHVPVAMVAKAIIAWLIQTQGMPYLRGQGTALRVMAAREIIVSQVTRVQFIKFFQHQLPSMLNSHPLARAQKNLVVICQELIVITR